ncbi:RTA1 like protein [Daldinia sp. FL1419]|nr:RTA1 like protein [Daldinia sp. FL1419]
MESRRCTPDTCPESIAVYGYRPNLGINVFFTVTFGVIAIWAIVSAIRVRRWIAYNTVVAFGALVEFVGYLFRDLGWSNPFNVDYFSIQFTLLTLAPVFITAGIYLSLKFIANTLGRGYFDINPKLYTIFFVSSDVIALVIQAVGGGLATSENTSDNPSPTDGLRVGTKITIAGLVLQVVSLCIFLTLFLAVVLYPRRQRYGHNSKTSQPHGLDTAPTPTETRGNVQGSLILFVVMLLLATTLILVRSCYRVAELSQGLLSSLATSQWLFVGLDGFMIAISTSLMVIVHPAVILCP